MVVGDGQIGTGTVSVDKEGRPNVGIPKVLEQLEGELDLIIDGGAGLNDFVVLNQRLTDLLFRICRD